MLDELRLAAWQRAGKKSRPKPKRISPLAKAREKRYGQVPEGRTPQQVAEMLSRYGPAGEPSPEQLQRRIDDERWKRAASTD